MTSDMNFDEIERARREDAAFFDRFPDREYRLRRAWDCEFHGERPAGFDVFAILHRQDYTWRRTTFGAPITFETSRTDAQIREILAKLAANPQAMLATS